MLANTKALQRLLTGTDCPSSGHSGMLAGGPPSTKERHQGSVPAAQQGYLSRLQTAVQEN